MSRSKKSNELPAYNSDDEETEKCVLCKESRDDPINFGKMISVGIYKLHLFCCVSLYLIRKFLQTVH